LWFRSTGGKQRSSRHWIDPPTNQSYDAVGPVPAGRFDKASFFAQLKRHLGKQTLDFMWVDLRGIRLRTFRMWSPR
jgi:hypothetical protein